MCTQNERTRPPHYLVDVAAAWTFRPIPAAPARLVTCTAFDSRYCGSDDLDDIAKIGDHITSSTVVLLFLSRGYFHSRACLNEVRMAQEAGMLWIYAHG